MCGIAGILDTGGTDSEADLTRLARSMADAIRHRGPDDEGVWCDPAAGLALGFRRLSIIDLSPAGHQPMVSASGRLAMVFNGEIYNAEDLRPELTAPQGGWRGHSDTEVMLEAFEQWGVLRTLARLIGMFAIALWDRRERRLTLVRDRLGKKPLYWSWRNGLLLFGSELRALRRHPRFKAELDRDAITLYLRHSYLPHPHTVYRGVNQVSPGAMVTFESGREPVVTPYWSLAEHVRAGMERPFEGSLEQAAGALESLLADAVERRMVADVPLGAFLSGGYDSSTVVALMQRASSRPVRTFSIGFHEKGYDEAAHAKAVAAHLGTDHTELYLTPEETRDVIPALPRLYDEPFADSSQIPTYLVSQLARRHVTVALSGDGGDELFAGYNRYAEAATFQSYAGRLPQVVRRLGAGALTRVSPSSWDRVFEILPERRRPRLAGDKLHKLAGVITAEGDQFYHRLTSLWQEPEQVVIGGREPATLITDDSVRQWLPGFIERMQYKDTLVYLPDDILTKVDRASMAVSLEARTPLLDHRIVEFAWRLPRALKIAGSDRKRVLKAVLYKYVPKALVERPKMGFGVPLDSWLRGPLRDWAEDLLSERRLAATGVFRPGPVRTRWQEHLSGRRNWQHPLWNVLMFEAWHAHWHGTNAVAGAAAA